MPLPQRGWKRLEHKRAKALLLLSLFFSVFAMANFATLHQLVHADAASAEHHCAATLLASGQIDAPSGITALVAPALPIAFLIFLDVPAPAGISFNVPLTRGPPAVLS